MEMKLRLVGLIGSVENIEELKEYEWCTVNTSIEKHEGMRRAGYSDILINLAVSAIPFLAKWIWDKKHQSSGDAKVTLFKDTQIGRVVINNFVIVKGDDLKSIERKLKEMSKL